MKKLAKRFLSMLLALSMVFGLMVFPVSATETEDDHDHSTQAEEPITVSMDDFQFSVDDAISFVPLYSDGVEADMEDPFILTLEAELSGIKVLNEDGESVPLTEEQIGQILQLFQAYLDHWADHADILGMQVPFFLSYNDDNEDGLGVLGEMLALANIPLAAVRAGQVSFDDITGMIDNFYYADALGVQLYGETIKAKRQEVMDLIANSGAKTEAQKLLILNDWIAHNVTFDMPYIMNNGKEEGKKPMVAPDGEQPHKYEQTVHDAIYDSYTERLQITFEDNIKNGLKSAMLVEYYKKAIESVLTDMYTQGAIQEMAKDENVIAAAAEAYAEEAASKVSDEELEELKNSEEYKDAYQEAYDAAYEEAYNKYVDEHCEEHAYTAEFVWTPKEGKEGEYDVAATLTCAICERTREETAKVEYDKVTEATCTEPKKTADVATVTVDGKPYTDEKNAAAEGTALGHDYDKEAADGICKRCGHACEHLNTAATSGKCNDCGYVKIHTHDWSNKDGKCKECGDTCDHNQKFDRNGVCTTCGYECPHTKFSTDIVTEATCTQEGKQVKKCGDCGKATEETIEKTAHVWNSETGKCDFCHTECTHDWSEKDGTCGTCGVACNHPDELVQDGQIGSFGQKYRCTQCGKEFETTEVDEETKRPLSNTENPDDNNSSAQEASFDEDLTVASVEVETETLNSTESEETAIEVEAEAEPVALNDARTDGEGEDKEEDKIPEKDAALIATAEAAATEKAKAAGREVLVKSVKDDAKAEFNAKSDEEKTEYVTNFIQNDEQMKAQVDAGVKTKVDEYMTAHNDEIEADPVAFIKGESESQEKIFLTEVPVTDADGNPVLGEDGNPVMMTIAAQLEAGADEFWADCEKNGVPGVDPEHPDVRVPLDTIVEQQMDTPQQDPMLQKRDEQGNPIEGEYMTPNEAIPVFAEQAAQGLTGGVLNYWQGSQFGALGDGTAVCLGYTKAFNYLVQYMHPEIYGTSADADMSNPENWKTRKDLYKYNDDGTIDVNQNYIVDAVRITFDASVTMYGETQENFNSDHFWTAIKVDGKWYYIDPCYVDVYTEVMMRDRVETDGSMNHMYFLFSDNTARSLYDGNFNEGGIKTLYEGIANHTDYEDSWISRIKSNTYFNGGYAYYIYDSTDLITLMDDYNNNNNMDYEGMDDKEIKLVKHKLTDSDNGNTAEEFDSLIDFNDVDDETVGVMVGGTENELLTKLYKQHVAEEDIYPSIAITAALHDGKVYFNLSNTILSYDLSSKEIAVVKEYNEVYGVRDGKIAFGGMAFTTSTSGLPAYNHPIAAMTIKDDGNMYVSIATNYAFISGKDPHDSEDQDSFGYEFEESNYNPDYSTYGTSDQNNQMMEQMGYKKEVNDNDEFMWSANFVDKISMSTLTHTHSYAAVEVPAYCGRNAYTENRCSCGAVEAGSHVEAEDSALAHHYVLFKEEYYTKSNSGAWNNGQCYVCTVCGFHIEEPTEPKENQYQNYEEEKAKYEKEKAIYDEAVETAGHTYVPTDAEWAKDYSSVSFQNMACSSVCPDRKPYLDCLLKDNSITIALEEKETNDKVRILSTTGTCEEGPTVVYLAEGYADYDSEQIEYSITKEVKQEPKDCDFSTGICPICGNSKVKRVAGADRSATAIAAADALKEALKVEKFKNIVLACGGFGGSEDNGFADALSGSYLAIHKEAPILLHYYKSQPTNFAYIKENLAANGTVYILGGNVSVPESVEAEIKEAGITVKRLAGADRFETNLAIVKEAGVTNEEILISSGWHYADALSISATGKPVLLLNTKNNKLTDSQKEFLAEHKSNKITVIGGTAAVSEDLKASIEEVVGGEKLDRVFGATREETSVAVAEKYFDAPSFAVVAYSRNFPDGLCGGPLAYFMEAPMLLTYNNKSCQEITHEYISGKKITAGYIMGGTAGLTDDTIKVVYDITSNAEIPSK